MVLVVNSYRSQQLPAPYKRLIDGINQNLLRRNDWTTDNLTNLKRLLKYDNRRIETHQWRYNYNNMAT